VFHVNGERRKAEVLPDFWRASDSDDIAVLRLLSEGGRLPEGLKPLTLGSARHCNGHTLRTAGFLALPGGYEFTWAEGQIRGVVPHPKKQAMLQMDTAPIRKGMSGAPVLDLDTQRVVGIVNEFMLDATLQWATTSDALAAICPDLRLYPPQAVEEYLRAVAQFCRDLPYVSLKSDVPLETVYVREQMRQELKEDQKTSDEETVGEELTAPELRARPMTVIQALEQHPCMVVVGRPGAGIHLVASPCPRAR
jgi:S1-C subfamily serine protease